MVGKFSYVFFGDQLIWYVDDFFYFFVVCQFDGCVYCVFILVFCILEDGGDYFVVFQYLQGIWGVIYVGDENMVWVFVQCLQGVDCYFIVVGGDGLDIFIVGYLVVDYIYCVIVGKFCGLFLDDFDVWVFCYYFFYFFGVVVSGFICQVVEQDCYIVFIVYCFCQCFYLQMVGENGV